MNVELLESARKLPLPERLELFDALWETLQADGYEPSLSPIQAKELDHRLEAHEKNPNDVVSWEQIKSESEENHDRS